MQAEAATPAMLKPADVAARLGIDVEGVLALIHASHLHAIDVRRPGARRPRWRVSPADLEIFLASRRTTTPAPRPPQRRRPENVTRYF